MPKANKQWVILETIFVDSLDIDYIRAVYGPYEDEELAIEIAVDLNEQDSAVEFLIEPLLPKISLN